ncbi:unnamed protein product, partial [Durusdinium trenchii]
LCGSSRGAEALIGPVAEEDRSTLARQTQGPSEMTQEVIARASVVMGSWAKCDTGHAEVALK